MTAPQTPLPPLTLPALRGHMGDWFYYAALFKLRDVAARVHVADEIHKSKTLNELIQRQLTRRSAQIREYLLTRPQRLFNAMVIGVYEGEPEWYELDVRRNPRLDPETVSADVKNALGLLMLRGDEQLFAIDGQHRLIGIREAVAAKPSLGDEEVGALFVAHRQDATGRERTRRLFTTLNRYAKPVSKSEIIALDEDDVVAVITRRLIDDHPLFLNKVSLKKGKNISPSDLASVTTVVALYDGLNDYLREGTPRKWNAFRAHRPADDIVERFFKSGRYVVDRLVRKFQPLREVQASEPTDRVAAKYRHPRGGHLLFRPVGFGLVMRTIRALTDAGKSPAAAVSAVARVPMELGARPWIGLLWNPQGRRMITSKDNQIAAERVLHYGAGVPFTRADKKNLVMELSGLMNLPPEKVKLERY
jgi:DNA sulfur modification protein DndB